MQLKKEAMGIVQDSRDLVARAPSMDPLALIKALSDYAAEAGPFYRDNTTLRRVLSCVLELDQQDLFEAAMRFRGRGLYLNYTDIRILGERAKTRGSMEMTAQLDSARRSVENAFEGVGPLGILQDAESFLNPAARITDALELSMQSPGRDSHLERILDNREALEVICRVREYDIETPYRIMKGIPDQTERTRELVDRISKYVGENKCKIRLAEIARGALSEVGGLASKSGKTEEQIVFELAQLITRGQEGESEK